MIFESYARQHIAGSCYQICYVIITERTGKIIFFLDFLCIKLTTGKVYLRISPQFLNRRFIEVLNRLRYFIVETFCNEITTFFMIL